MQMLNERRISGKNISKLSDISKEPLFMIILCAKYLERLQMKKRIALVAHDNKKPEILAWAKEHKEFLSAHELYGTGSTGRMIEKELMLPVSKFHSGPVGGDLQIGAKIAEGNIDLLIFFWDPLEPQPHDPDVKALLRIAVVWNVSVACNRASADYIITSPLMGQEYHRSIPDYGKA
jgi:methylglyoxal synthase